ncbi:hypothetical protein Bbelb_288790 [Branchiostoma belcheri]|nr:hypothetical protein Bbelb_288790 [Branchiostoma belcheri]
MSGTALSEQTAAVIDEDNPIYQPEDNPHWSTSLLETQELSTLYTENTDSETMSTAPGNVSSIDEERSAAEATDIADNAEPVYHNSCVNQFEHNPEDNHGASGPPVDASDLEDTDRAPASNIQHPDTTGRLVDTIINPDTGDIDISENIEEYANERSNEPDTHDYKDPNKRVLTNPMYEELPDTSTQQTENNVSNEHDLQGPSNTNDSKGDRKIQKLQSQPNMKSLQQNVMYGGYIPNQWAGDDSPIYRYWWLIVLVMVGLITTGILVGMKHNTQDHGNPTVPPMHMQESTNWDTTFIVMTEPDDTNQTSLGDTNGLSTQKPEIGTIITFGGYGKGWKKQGDSWKKMKRRKLYGKFNQVTGVAVSSNDEVFVSDNWNRRIQVFNIKGVFLRSFGTDKMRPLDIVIDQNDTLWVLLTRTNHALNEQLKPIKKKKTHINRYSKEGRVLERFTCAANLKFTKKIALDTLSNDIIMIITRRDDKVRAVSAGRFYKKSCAVQAFGPEELMWLKWPASVAVDKEGNIYITEQQNHNVLKYDKNGKYINCFGRKGDESSNHLKSPVGICVDSLGRIIVADNGNNRVDMFTAEGEYIANIAYITRPQFVAIGREGQLIVSSQNNYVTIFPKY